MVLLLQLLFLMLYSLSILIDPVFKIHIIVVLIVLCNVLTVIYIL